jgi:hypothetical protein
MGRNEQCFGKVWFVLCFAAKNVLMNVISCILALGNQNKLKYYIPFF